MKVINNILYYISRILNRRLVSIKDSCIHKKASIGNGAQIVECLIGKYTYIYNSTVINTNIGSFCSIASNCIIGGGNHPVNWLSTSPVFYKGKNVLRKNFSNNEFIEYKKTFIGNDVWIGSRCLIKGGVKIGNGVIIGMGSVVTKDIPSYEIWAGNPAKFIRKRFNKQEIEKIEKLEWWNWSEKELEKNGELFKELALLDKIGEN